VVENYYKSQNNSEVGNIAQSLSYINGNYYLVVNNSGKVIVCDKQFKKIGQITGLTSPRYILQVSNQKAYVSDLYANAISVVNLNTNVKTSSIACFGKAEKMILIYNTAFVTNSDKEYVYVINTVTDFKTDSVFVGKNASSLVLDKDDKVWVLANGASNTQGKLTRINPITFQIELVLDFKSVDSPTNLCLNKTKDTLYFLNDGIYQMPVTWHSLPQSSLIPKGNRNFYALGINPNDYSIYAADALDYVQRSNIYIFDTRANQKTIFKAGLISNGFYFE
jgi:hypothetical protein